MVIDRGYRAARRVRKAHCNQPIGIWAERAGCQDIEEMSPSRSQPFIEHCNVTLRCPRSDSKWPPSGWLTKKGVLLAI
jgi:hypothetical protein